MAFKKVQMIRMTEKKPALMGAPPVTEYHDADEAVLVNTDYVMMISEPHTASEAPPGSCILFLMGGDSPLVRGPIEELRRKFNSVK